MEVEEVMREFSAQTVALMDVRYTRVIRGYETPLEYAEFLKLWRRALSGESGSAADTPFVAEMLEIIAAWLQLCAETKSEEPIFLCCCVENGDEFLVRRIPSSVKTKHRWSLLLCKYSEMSDCIPRNKQRELKPPGSTSQYVFMITHVEREVRETPVQE